MILLLLILEQRYIYSLNDRNINITSKKAQNHNNDHRLLCSLSEMLLDYERIENSIPPVISPLMKPYIDRVEEALKPGLVSLSWSSLNVEECKLPGR